MNTKKMAITGNLMGVILFLGSWQLLIWVFGMEKFVLPSPLSVMKIFLENWKMLLESAWPTLQEIVYGFSLSVCIGIPLAVVMVSYRRLEQLISPILIFSQTIPKVAVAPLFVIWFGFGMLPKVLIAFLISFLNTLILLVWFQTNAFAEYFKNFFIIKKEGTINLTMMQRHFGRIPMELKCGRRV